MSINFQNIHRKPWVGRTFACFCLSATESFNLYQLFPKMCWKYINKFFGA